MTPSPDAYPGAMDRYRIAPGAAVSLARFDPGDTAGLKEEDARDELEDLNRRLEGLPALLVTLKPPFEVLERRVAERAMTKKLPVEVLGEDAARKIVERLDRLRDWFYGAVYANTVSDLTIDTSVHGPDEVAGMIEERLRQGPGTAFAELRTIWPKP